MSLPCRLRFASRSQPEFAAPGDKLTTSRVHSFENRIAELRADKEARRARIQPSCDAILGIWDDIGHAASGDEEAAIAAGPEAVGFADADIEKLETCLEFWQAEKASREERIREIGERITVLWEKLDTPEGEQTTFLESHNGLGDDVIAACKAYMHAKAEEFQARLDELVAVSSPPAPGSPNVALQQAAGARPWQVAAHRAAACATCLVRCCLLRSASATAPRASCTLRCAERRTPSPHPSRAAAAPAAVVPAGPS